MADTAGIQKLVTFSEQLFKLGSKRAKKLGLPFNEYIRFLMATDISNHENQIEILDEQTEKDLHEAMEDIKAGRYTEMKSKEDIKSFFDQIDRETDVSYVHDKKSKKI